MHYTQAVVTFAGFIWHLDPRITQHERHNLLEFAPVIHLSSQIDAKSQATFNGIQLEIGCRSISSHFPYVTDLISSLTSTQDITVA